MEPNLTDKIVIALFASFFTLVAGVFGINAWRNINLYSKPQAPIVNSQPQHDVSIPVLSEAEGWKTYRNEKYGFTLNYQSDLPELRVLINDLSPITYSLVAGEPIFEIHLFDNADQFSNPLWKFDDGYDHQLTYSATGKNWIVTLANRDWNRVSGPPDESCPLEYTTSNQGVPYYRITTGYHAGDGFNAYITDKKFIAVVGGDYYESGKFYPEKITFDHPELVLKATCHIVNAGR